MDTETVVAGAIARPHLNGSTSTTAEGRVQDIRSAKDMKLTVFREADAKFAGVRDENGKPIKMPKVDRDQLIFEQFPSTQNLDWEAALSQNDDLFARIMRDIIKLDQREPGKAGPRSNNLDFDKGVATFRQLMGQDYSNLPFVESFIHLCNGMSIRQIARKTHISTTEVMRLRKGERQPTEYDMRRIADGFNKHPSYFVEYRRAYIIDHLADALLKEPESTIAYYRKIVTNE